MQFSVFDDSLDSVHTGKVKWEFEERETRNDIVHLVFPYTVYN